MENEEFWPLQKRVDDLLHVLVMNHRKVQQWSSPQFRAYKSRQSTWLEHSGLPGYKNRVAMQLEDVGTLRARKMVRLIGDRPEDKTFDLTAAGIAFHDEHCKRDSH